jgi:Uncharacterized membrane protein, required for colicin V production
MNFAIDFIDLAVVAIILISAIYATYRGLVSESLSVFGWIAAAYATLFFGPFCAGWFRGILEPRWLGELVGYVVVFLVVLIPLHFASSRIAVNVKRSQVGTLDSVLGTGFGILRGLAIVGISFIIYMMIFPGRPPGWIMNARLYPLIYASAEIVASVTPVDNPHFDGTPGRNHRGNSESHPPARIDDLLQQQDQPFHKTDSAPPAEKSQRKAGDDPLAPVLEKASQTPQDATSEPKTAKTHTEKAQNEAEDTPRDSKKSAAGTKQDKQVKKTYGAKDRHALDRLIETSHSDASGKP